MEGIEGMKVLEGWRENGKCLTEMKGLRHFPQFCNRVSRVLELVLQKEIIFLLSNTGKRVKPIPELVFPLSNTALFSKLISYFHSIPTLN